MDVYFTTVVRSAPVSQGGELIRLDWRSKQVRARVPIVPGDPDVVDPNPRGNTRGGRGVVLRNGRLHVAGYHSVLLFDRDLRQVGRLDNNLFAGLHELSQSPQGLWCAATAIDAAILVDDAGRTLDSWWARETPKLHHLLGLTPRALDKTADNRLRFLGKEHSQGTHTHLNAATWHDGCLYVLLNRYGMVYNATRDEVVVHRPEMRGAHNVSFAGDRILVNDTRGRKVLVFSRRDGSVQQVDLLAFPLIRKILRKSWPRRAWWRLTRSEHIPIPIFVRGLHVLDERRALVGLSPATVIEIDFESGKLLDAFQLTQDLATCVHGLVGLPN